MYGSKRQGAAGVLPESTQSSGTEAAILTLSRVQRFAAEQRAIAEDTLAKARDFEEQIANERAALAECVAAAEAAEAGEREAEAHLSAAREQLAAASNAQARAQAEVDARRQLVAERHEARVACDADVARMREHIELPPDASGLTPDALKRIVERRIADGIRTRAQHGTP
jgi:chromosome segregation ATPase